MKDKMLKKSEEKSVVVYDAIMGSGKTYDAIQRMKKYIKNGEKFIYITPFLEEISRVMNSLPLGEVYAPLGREENDNKSIYQLECNLIDENGNFDLNADKNYKHQNKRAQFMSLAAKGENIISTHALFKSLKKEDFSLFKDYILILDEVVNPLGINNIGARDIQILRNEELIVIDQETNEVKFIDDDYNDPAFQSVRYLCNNGTVFYLDNFFFVWIFPIEIFREFKEVQVLTYLFEGSFLSAYFKMFNVQYELIKNESIQTLAEIRSLLNIYEGKANDNSKVNTSYSKTWCDKISKKQAKKISDATSNLFKRVFKTKSSENAYTTFLPYKSKFAGKGYTSGYIAINARATNDYKHKKSMAYLGNRFCKPQELSFFRERGITLNEELWALSELIQWVWRGCIRENQPMNLYIPNYRMRSLLIDWLDGKFLEETNNFTNLSIDFKKTA